MSRDVRVERRGEKDSLEFLVYQGGDLRAKFYLARREDKPGGLGIFQAIYMHDVETDRFLVDFRKYGFCARLKLKRYARSYAKSKDASLYRELD